jgi:hypothetical protein
VSLLESSGGFGASALLKVVLFSTKKQEYGHDEDEPLVRSGPRGVHTEVGCILSTANIVHLNFEGKTSVHS